MDYTKERILITGGTGFWRANSAHFLIQKLKVPPENIGILYLENSEIPFWLSLENGQLSHFEPFFFC